MKFLQAKTKVASTTYRRIHSLSGAGGEVTQRVEKADGMYTIPIQFRQALAKL